MIKINFHGPRAAVSWSHSNVLCFGRIFGDGKWGYILSREGQKPKICKW